MFGHDRFWEHIRLAYNLEIKRRLIRVSRWHGLRTAQIHFEPGEIAHVSGGVGAAYHDFLSSEGYSLFPGEKWRGNYGHRRVIQKYCVVLRREDSERYLVCYLTTFGGSGNLSPLAKFFGFALQDTPEWPPGVKPIKTHPPWKGQGYVFGVPVIRRGLEVPHLRRRIMLGFGELERIRKMVDERVDAFKTHNLKIRKAELAYASEGSCIDDDADAESEEMYRMNSGTDNRDPDETIDDIGTPTPLPRTLPTIPLLPSSRFCKPRIHYLHVSPHRCSIRWPLHYLHEDIIYSSSFRTDRRGAALVAEGLQFLKRR